MQDHDKHPLRWCGDWAMWSAGLRLGRIMSPELSIRIPAEPRDNVELATDEFKFQRFPD